ncbi:MAG: hypothetical protein CL678_16745 [Bdellovibrionaceae bacterium]|nr:hypothetical protein [Pseudobdellovibrionaceae bacterium]|tara:strand:+ start:650 stop:1564 length:915 start_codon:yes stop_codon:yes gene_type:complete
MFGNLHHGARIIAGTLLTIGFLMMLTRIEDHKVLSCEVHTLTGATPSNESFVVYANLPRMELVLDKPDDDLDSGQIYTEEKYHYNFARNKVSKFLDYWSTVGHSELGGGFVPFNRTEIDDECVDRLNTIKTGYGFFWTFLTLFLIFIGGLILRMMMPNLGKISETTMDRIMCVFDLLLGLTTILYAVRAAFFRRQADHLFDENCIFGTKWFPTAELDHKNINATGIQCYDSNDAYEHNVGFGAASCVFGCMVLLYALLWSITSGCGGKTLTDDSLYRKFGGGTTGGLAGAMMNTATAYAQMFEN